MAPWKPFFCCTMPGLNQVSTFYSQMDSPTRWSSASCLVDVQICSSLASDRLVENGVMGDWLDCRVWEVGQRQQKLWAGCRAYHESVLAANSGERDCKYVTDLFETSQVWRDLFLECSAFGLFLCLPVMVKDEINVPIALSAFRDNCQSCVADSDCHNQER